MPTNYQPLSPGNISQCSLLRLRIVQECVIVEVFGQFVKFISMLLIMIQILQGMWIFPVAQMVFAEVPWF